ncbi:NAD(P)/FAD-dependent oxidoreductase [Sphingomonas bacterium]|uniref:FAD/NAD(P)-dependent oxidoreductase n=1 Tax=Sphingomonas bacterium TaxID=1895847 RepID=UPI001575E070|nr:NAD(P)/FAD-dependent oxidoreductase [Sphingomonas bacterium]
MTEPVNFDVVIVGGGPAGLAAARTLAPYGLSIAVIDEQQRPGGQILRQPASGVDVADWLGGDGYRDVKAELAAFESTRPAVWFGGRSVIGLARDADGFAVRASGPWDVLRLAGREVLVAAGCYDLPVPLPGWTLPGVMAAGGVQAFVKAQQLVPGHRFVFAGTHPLMLVVASQIVSAGGEVALVAFDQPLSRALRVLLSRVSTAARHLGPLLAAADAVRVLRRHRVPIRYGLPLAGMSGDGRVAEATFASGAAKLSVPCDRVALCYGFVPQSDLTRLAGAASAWAQPAGGWRTRHDEWMRTSVGGLAIAGETSGVAGAASALEEGRLAAIGILRRLGKLDQAAAERAATPVRRRLARQRRFADLLAAVADPGPMLARAVAPETILCRCEDVSYGSVSAALTEVDAPSAIKLATRCGMGLCQGRSCEAPLMREIARRRGEQVGAIGGFTARFPVRPVRIGDFVAAADLAAAATNSPDAED